MVRLFASALGLADNSNVASVFIVVDNKNTFLTATVSFSPVFPSAHFFPLDDE